jgi:hypothetical protein
VAEPADRGDCTRSGMAEGEVRLFQHAVVGERRARQELWLLEKCSSTVRGREGWNQNVGRLLLEKVCVYKLAEHVNKSGYDDIFVSMKMSKNRKHLKRRRPTEPENKKKIALVTKGRLILVISILIAILAALFFKAGYIFWPAWMIEYQKLFMALILFLIIFLTLLSPIIIEANSDPRPLSGPGKNPETNLTDFFK